jgi:hypothetical protein
VGVRYVGFEHNWVVMRTRFPALRTAPPAVTGAHLWAGRYDGKLEDVFDLQDQITEKVVGVVEPSLRQSEIEHSRRKRPENLDAYDLYLRALPHLASVMPADARIAAGFLEDALRLDPNYAAAHAFLAWCHENLLRVAAHVLERQDCNRRLVGQSASGGHALGGRRLQKECNAVDSLRKMSGFSRSSSNFVLLLMSPNSKQMMSAVLENSSA